MAEQIGNSRRPLYQLLLTDMLRPAAVLTAVCTTCGNEREIDAPYHLQWHCNWKLSELEGKLYCMGRAVGRSAQPG